MRAILYYTDNTLDGTSLGEYVKDQLRGIEESIPDIKIFAVSQKPIDFGLNIVVGEKPKNHLSMVEQIITGLESIDHDWYVFMAEHDCLYHPSHYDYSPQTMNTFSYDVNVFRSTAEGYHRDNNGDPGRWLLSMCSAQRDQMLNYWQKMILMVRNTESKKLPHMEPGGNRIVDGLIRQSYSSEFPSLDIRHPGCLTGQEKMKVTHQTVKYWGDCTALRKSLGMTENQTHA